MESVINNSEGYIRVQYDSMEAIFTNLFTHFYTVLEHVGSVPFYPIVGKEDLTITWKLIDTFVEHGYKLRSIKLDRECIDSDFSITDLFLGKEIYEVIVEKEDESGRKMGLLMLTNNLKLHEIQLDVNKFKCVFIEREYLDCKLERVFLEDCINYAKCILDNQFEYSGAIGFIDQCTELVQSWLGVQRNYKPFRSYIMKMVILSNSVFCLHDLNLQDADNIFLGLNPIFKNKPAIYIDPLLLKGSMLDSLDCHMLKIALEVLRYRDIFIFRQGYAALTSRVLDKLADITKGSKCLELFAGKCIISKYLSDSGINIIPTDSNDYQYNLYTPQYQCMPFEEIDAVKAVEKYSNMDYIIMSWIPYNYNTKPLLDVIRKYSPNAKIIYIGELGGCTADSYFSEYYKALGIEVNEELLELYTAFEGLHDTCTVGTILPEIDTDAIECF